MCLITVSVRDVSDHFVSDVSDRFVSDVSDYFVSDVSNPFVIEVAGCFVSPTTLPAFFFSLLMLSLMLLSH